MGTLPHKKTSQHSEIRVLFYEGERKIVLENGFPLLLVLPLTLPKTFTRATLYGTVTRQDRPTLLRPPAT